MVAEILGGKYFMDGFARKRGRRKLDRKELRDVCVAVRFNCDEIAQLDAMRGRQQRGAFLRNLAISGIRPVPEVNQNALSLIRIAGNNLNQVAKHVNSSEVPDIEFVKNSLAEIRKILRGIQHEGENNARK